MVTDDKKCHKRRPPAYIIREVSRFIITYSAFLRRLFFIIEPTLESFIETKFKKNILFFLNIIKLVFSRKFDFSANIKNATSDTANQQRFFGSLVAKFVPLISSGYF